MNWQPKNVPQILRDSEVHIWRVDLDQLSNQFSLLSNEEQQRTTKMPIALPRQRFINARGTLRRLLASYLNLPAKEIILASTPRGKLYLPHNNNLHFNLTHSRNMAIYAFNYTHEIGIDIEVKRSLKNAVGIANRIFSPAELEYFHNTKISQILEEKFFTLWTRKEALVKATGEGLAAAVHEITTTQPDGHISHDIDYAKPLQLQLCDLPDIEHCSAAVATHINNKYYHHFILTKGS